MTRILIADDDPVVREVVRRYLERDGLQVVEAADGASAAAALHGSAIDLAILDVMMPPRTGSSCAARSAPVRDPTSRSSC